MSTRPHINEAESHKISLVNLIVKPIYRKRVELA